jgi:hypothetical protein
VTEITTGCSEVRPSLPEIIARARELRASGAVIRQRLLATKRDFAETLARACATDAAVREHLAALKRRAPGPISSKPSSAVLEALAVLGRDESHLDEMTDDLIAAYQTATAVGDDELQGLLAGALMQIGRHLATQIGPKAANIIMN